MNALAHSSLVQPLPFRSQLIAGFECGAVNGRCLADETLHTPTQRMHEHYWLAKQYGMYTVRDGLPPGANVALRMQTAAKRDMQPIWDIQHQWTVPDPHRYVDEIARVHSLSFAGPLWVCNNEPAIMPMFTPVSREDSVRLGVDMVRRLRETVATKVLTTDPFRDGSDAEFASTDALVRAGYADVIGLNMYPHLLLREPSEIVAVARARYPGMPVIIGETSWHSGYHQWTDIHNKGDWLVYMLRAGADAVCWYPIVDSPDWNTPDLPRWSHGLIREDLSVDPLLSTAMLDFAPNGVWR